MAAGVLERHASVAGSSAGTARAPPAGLGPTSPARDASARRALRAPARAAPSAPPPSSSRGAPGSRSRRSLLPPRARALDRVRHALLASPRLSRGQNHYVDGRDALDLAEERRHRPGPADRARGAQTPAAGDDRPEEPRQVGGRPGHASGRTPGPDVGRRQVAHSPTPARRRLYSSSPPASRARRGYGPT